MFCKLPVDNLSHDSFIASQLSLVTCFAMFHRPKSPLLGTAVAPSNSGSAGDTERGASAMGPYQRGAGEMFNLHLLRAGKELCKEAARC